MEENENKQGSIVLWQSFDATAAIEAINDVWENIKAAVMSVAEALTEAFQNLAKWLDIENQAFKWAETARPEWVRIYRRTKKKRTRKKYHDRIMRAYEEILRND